MKRTGEKPERAQKAKPFVKWAGGKAQLLPELLTRVPSTFRAYHEPFLGGGALFFALSPKKAFLSDVNEELINAFLVVKEAPEKLMKDLKKHAYSKDHFYEVRSADRLPSYKRWGSIRKAGRLIYLNKTCYNGLYRVNSRGEFNTPFGDYKNPKILDKENLLACSAALKNANISVASFEKVLRSAKKGDFVYFDPPYAPLSATANFTGYAKGGFDAYMQKELRDVCVALDKKGVKFMASNSSAPLVLDLYKKFHLEYLSASRAINSKGQKRGKIKEVIARNW